MKYQILLLGFLSVLWSNCSNQKMEDQMDAHAHEVDDHLEMAEEEVILTNVQIKNIGLTYDKIKSRSIRSTVELTGRIELPPSGKAVVGSALEGKIEEVYVAAGQKVVKGQRLFALQNLDIIDWQQQLSEQKAALVYLEKDLARQQELAQQQLAPKKNYEAAQSKFSQTVARIKALDKKLEDIGIRSDTLRYTSRFYVTAPQAGIIQHLLVSTGEYVTRATPLADILNNKNLHLHLLAFGEQIGKLEEGQLLNFYVQSRPDRILQAKIFWINEMVDTEDNSYDVHAEIVGDVSLLSPGEFVEARVIDQERLVNTLPSEAITSDKGLYYIFAVEGADESSIHFSKVQVNRGVSDLGYVEILPIDDIPDGSDIAVEGAFFIMAQSKKGEEGTGHHH
ncbi:MAG: efflux RND transporter periplasmic adaptor subunit [Saprospiraceae bacterium]|nr:efflux RND transporter periplasmic adaptor subunit [Saprospiraceae bacterium]